MLICAKTELTRWALALWTLAVSEYREELKDFIEPVSVLAVSGREGGARKSLEPAPDKRASFVPPEERFEFAGFALGFAVDVGSSVAEVGAFTCACGAVIIFVSR
jgi:hypothetical protein